MSYQSEVLADAPLAYWRLGEASGSVAADTSGAGRDGTYVNAPTLGVAGLLTGDADPAVSFNGVDEAMTVPYGSWMNTSAFTVEAIIRPSVIAGGTRTIMERRDKDAAFADLRNQAWQFRILASGALELLLLQGTSGASSVAATGITLAAGNTYHVAASFDPPAGNVRFYVNGTLYPSSRVGPTSTNNTTCSSNITLAQTRNGGVASYQEMFAGTIDEAAYYGGVLSDARIKAHYDASLTAGPAPTTVTGALAATAAKATVSLSGTTPAAAVTGALSATAPAAVVALTGTAPDGPVAGALAAIAAPAMVALTGTVPTAAIRLEPWSKDESRKTRALAVTSGVLDFTPPLEMPPDGVVERPLMRESVIVPALKDIAGVIVDPVTGQPHVPDDVFAALPRVEEEVGVPHVLFSDLSAANDRTYWRGSQIRVLRDRCEEPFGDVSLTLDLPQVTSMDVDADSAGNDSPLNWSRNRSNVEIVMRKSDGTTRRGVWTGHVVTHDGGNDERSSVKTLTCHGSLWQAASTLHRAPNLLDPTDVGTLVPKALNDVVSRRYPKVPTVTTGIMSRQRGTWSDSQMAFAQELLSTAQTSGGRQWTVAKVEGSRRTYEMRLKKDAPSWTVTNGAPGVAVSLSKDATVIRNVVYGHGVGPDGYAWWNYHYPNLRRGDAPAYPYSSAGTVMSVGSTDAGTSSGEGVSVWQRRARDLGYNVAVDGVFNDADATAARAIQRRYGLQVDGVVGPQTWAATFDVGGNGGDLSGAIRLPLAADPRTQRYIYNADGSVAGDNPAYDVNVIAYEADIGFGPGVTREQGIEAAQQIVDRESEPALVGQITLKADPREGSRFFIPTGDKISLLGYEGHDPVLHITARERDWQNLTVTLEVDERARDAMTVQEIRDRNKAARKDPARRPGNVERRSRLVVDQVVPFDGESGAGWIPRLALYGGLWTVIRVPVSELGRVARIDCTTSGPASKFAVALFGSPIQPAHLNANVGNPLASDDPFGPKARLLEDRFGFIEAWGQKGQACGYGYGSEQDNSPLTGEFHDTGGFEYVSQRPPWIWVAFYSAASTFVSGRILPAPIQ